MRNFTLAVFTMLLFITMASAQIPTVGNVYFGYSYYNTSLGSINRQGLNGWTGSLEGKVFPMLGVVVDLSGNYGTQKFPSPAGTCAIGVVCSPVSVSTHFHEVLFGPRVSAPVGRLRPFGEVMFGVGHASTNGFGTDTSLATAVGGGIDCRLLRLLAWRFQGDYVHTSLFNNHQNNVRLTTGIVVRF